MSAGKLNIMIEQGATFSKTLTIKDAANIPINLTGKTFASKLRRRPTDMTAAAQFTFSIIDAPAGRVRWALTAGQTAQLVAEPHYYDIEMTDGAIVTRLMQGTAFVEFEVTK